MFGPWADELLVRYEGTGAATRRWLHADERGSIIAVSGSTGASTQKNSYDAYGTPASTNQGRFQYTGQMWIPELGLYHYKARIYSPTLGRFLQTDPIGYADGMNLYAYVGNDPVNRVDPLGLKGDPTPFDIIVTARREITVPDLPRQPQPGRVVGGGGGGRNARGSSGGPASPGVQSCAAPGPRNVLNGAIQEAQARRASDLVKINAAIRQFGIKEAYPMIVSIQIQSMNWYISKVRTGGDWDFKNQPETRGNRDFGNFAFGATADALGYGDFAHLGADLYSLWENGSFEDQDDMIDAGQEYYSMDCQRK